MRVRNNKRKSTMNKNKEHEARKINAIGARRARMKMKSNKTKSTKNKSEEQ